MDFIQSLFESLKGSSLDFISGKGWVQALLILGLFLLISKSVILFFNRILRKLAQKTKTRVDDQIIEISKNPLRILFILIGVLLALIPLDLTPGAYAIFKNIIISVIIYLAGLFLVRIIRLFLIEISTKITGTEESTFSKGVVPLLDRLVMVLIVIIGFLLILSQWGVHIGPFLASLGIAGLAVALAIKDSLANIFGGISVILDKNLKIGDKVRLDTGEFGIIQDVGLRSTKLRTFDNEIIIIPNGQLANTRLKNYGILDPKLRSVVNFAVAYGTEVAKVQRVVLEVIKTIDEALDDPAPSVEFLEMGDFFLKFVAKFWLADYNDEYRCRLIATTKIYDALNKEKINIPFPTHTVHIAKSD